MPQGLCLPIASSTLYQGVVCHLRWRRHPAYLCPNFKTMNLDSKYAFVRDNRLCYNCLGSSHHTRDCRSSVRCHKCGKSHHTSLHKDTVPAPQEASAAYATAEHTTGSATVNIASAPPVFEPTLIMTAQVIIESPDGRQLAARALLDLVASLSLVTQRVVQYLQLKKNPHQVILVHRERPLETAHVLFHFSSRQSRIL